MPALTRPEEADVVTALPDGPTPLASALEAILLSSDRPSPAARLAEALTLHAGEGVAENDIAPLVEELNAAYDTSGRSFRIEPIAGGYRVMTREDYADVVAAYHRAGGSARLSRAALETLALVAYRQPVTRAELEAIRGVATGEVLRSLIDRGMVKIAGRAEEPGRPLLYATTKRFLDVFGLASLKDLPKPGELGVAGGLAPPDAGEAG